MKRAALCLAILVSGAVPGVSQSQDDVLARIRHEALERSQVHALFSTLTDQIGPRLAGTPAYKQSAEWARDRLREFGLADARLDPFPFGRGWVLDRLVVEMVEPRYMPLIGLSFRAAGVPGFNPIQEYKDYDVGTHHTNVDLYERVREQDLKQNAIVMAWFAWQAANTAERIPRP